MSKLIVAVALSCLACGSSSTESIGPEPVKIGVERPDASSDTPALVPGDSPAASPATATETCSNPFGTGALAGSSAYYASHAYPGMSVAQLASVQALVGSGGGILQAGFTSVLAPIAIRDGMVAVFNCRQGSTVTFVGP